MDVIARLDETRAAVNVLEHPFYRRWVTGELSAPELGRYAGEYRHAVVALADASRRAASRASAADAPGLSRHAEEEQAHVALWERFAGAVGAPAPGAAPAGPLTGECVAAWTAGEDLLEHLAVLYVIEAGQPEISRTKIDGLVAHYGYADEGPATEYFALHERRDVEHARDARELIERLLSESAHADAHAERMIDRAERALRANWGLLDGVQQHAPA